VLGLAAVSCGGWVLLACGGVASIGVGAGAAFTGVEVWRECLLLALSLRLLIASRLDCVVLGFVVCFVVGPSTSDSYEL
jgi:hypothetical protein